VPVRVLVGALVVQLLLGGLLVFFAFNGFPFVGDLGGDDGATKAKHEARFDAGHAYADVRRQVELGPRPAGSAASRELATELRARLPAGRFEAVPGGLRNVTGRLPGRKPAVLLAAHYDTKDLPGFVGANDGAAGVAVVLEVADALRALKRPPDAPEIRFAFFDGEEQPKDAPGDDFERYGLRGSKAYAARHSGGLGAVIVVDFVGQKHLTLRRDFSASGSLWRSLSDAARRAGKAATFPDDTQTEILDDHTPFLRRGVKAIDLIDFEYRCFHERCDDLRRIDRRSLDAVGESLVELLRGNGLVTR
jgi:glutaminyl-peptide cyclotransferase